LAATQTLIIVEGIPEAPSPDVPIAYFLGAQVPYGWWHLSLPFYKALLPKLGFSITRVTTKDYLSHGSILHKLTTIVSRQSDLEPVHGATRNRRSAWWSGVRLTA